MADRKGIVTVSLLAEAEPHPLGSSLRRAYAVEADDGLEGLLRAIDRAEFAVELPAARMRQR